MGFRLVPKSVTLMNGLEWRNAAMTFMLRYFTEFGNFGGQLVA